MAKEEPKTQANQASVEAFVAAVPDERRRGEAQTIDALFARLGKHKTGKSCLYINKLTDIDLDALEALVALSWQAMGEAWPD